METGRATETEKRLEGEGTMLYYTPCTNRRGISPACRVAHGAFSARRKNHPTLPSAANNTRNRFLGGRAGRAYYARERAYYYYYYYYDYYHYYYYY